jgi:hypothetical protein
MQPSKRSLTYAAVAALVALSTVSAAYVAVNHVAADDTVKIASFDRQHLVLDYKVTHEAKASSGQVVVSVKDMDLRVRAADGKSSSLGSVTTNKETDDPSCTNLCYQGFHFLEAESRPGLTRNGQTWEFTRWVAWYHYPTMKAGGKSTIDFEVELEGLYGEWELIVTPGVLTYQASAWGNTYYQYAEAEPITQVFKVVQG